MKVISDLGLAAALLWVLIQNWFSDGLSGCGFCPCQWHAVALLPAATSNWTQDGFRSLLASLIHCCIAPWPYESWVTADRNMTDPSDSENPKLSKLPYLCLPPKSGSQVSIHLVSQVDLAFVSRSLLYILSLYLSQLLPGLVWWSFWTLVPIGRFSKAGLLVNALCNLLRKKSREVAAHFQADFWVSVASHCV